MLGLPRLSSDRSLRACVVSYSVISLKIDSKGAVLGSRFLSQTNRGLRVLALNTTKSTTAYQGQSRPTSLDRIGNRQ